MPLAASTKRLIEECAGLNTRTAGRLGPELEFLVWASPTSYRDPEDTKLWHPVYLEKPAAYKLLVHCYLYLRYAFIGMARCFAYRGFSYAYKEAGAPLLIVMAEEITDHSAELRTDYIIEDVSHPEDKLVFSRLKKIGKDFTALGIWKKMMIGERLEMALIADLMKQLVAGRLSMAYLDSLALFHRWVISYSWCFHYDFYKLMRVILGRKQAGYRSVFVPHEMHFYSRMAWKAAKGTGVRGITAQHAMILPEKLWYFPDAAEVKAGCALPDIFYVYSEGTKALLGKSYPGTDFRLCCGPRFRKWKDTARPDRSRADALTFVCGIMAYDTAIIVKAAKALLAEGYGAKRRIRLRLHPAGIINRAQKEWIGAAAKAGSIELSNVPLREEFEMSRMIVGSNSAVLQEAVLSGVPALALTSNEYICASVLPDDDKWTIDVSRISWKIIEERSVSAPDRDTVLRSRANMGLDNRDLTTATVAAA
ncbi:MAG: hypothetical protein PHE80_00130 [Candidatus Omnitrophica bacterium]|nr:hypothetical protein [Candidatus Omnitrophota bacterium]MDD5736852.1 hypothetical protein [Candidatus Omnitrophota bacterium]